MLGIKKNFTKRDEKSNKNMLDSTIKIDIIDPDKLENDTPVSDDFEVNQIVEKTLSNQTDSHVNSEILDKVVIKLRILSDQKKLVTNSVSQIDAQVRSGQIGKIESQDLLFRLKNNITTLENEIRLYNDLHNLIKLQKNFASIFQNINNNFYNLINFDKMKQFPSNLHQQTEILNSNLPSNNISKKSKSTLDRAIMNSLCFIVVLEWDKLLGPTISYSYPKNKLIKKYLDDNALMKIYSIISASNGKKNGVFNFHDFNVIELANRSDSLILLILDSSFNTDVYIEKIALMSPDLSRYDDVKQQIPKLFNKYFG